MNLRSAAPLNETLAVVVELTEIDTSSSSGRLKISMRSRLFQPAESLEGANLSAVVAQLEETGVLVCEATTLVISAPDHGEDLASRLYAHLVKGGGVSAAGTSGTSRQPQADRRHVLELAGGDRGRGLSSTGDFSTRGRL